MTRSQRRLAAFVLFLPLLLAGLATFYVVAMDRLEGKRRSFWQGLEWAAGALSTTGFGPDVSWSHPAMVVVVALVQFAGVFLLFLLVPILLIPFLDERFGRRLPSPPADLAGHLVVFRWGPSVETLAERAADQGARVAVVEPDLATARELAERGLPVVHGGAGSASLARAGLARARALVVNGHDDENGFAVLLARELGFAGEIVALVDEPLHRKALTLAGATRVFTPRHVLGAALATRASARVSPFVAGLDPLGGRLHVRELRIEAGSELAGATVGASEIGSATGAVVLGVWKRGRFVAPVDAATRLEVRDVAVAAGDEESLAALARRAGGAALGQRAGRIVVAGAGETGRAAADVLRAVGEEVLTLDAFAAPGVDLVGDARQLRTLEAAGVAGARTVVLALSDDAAALFTTLLVRDLAPEVPIVARANTAANVERIHRAGADFVLSTGQVAGQIVAGSLFGRVALGLDGGLEIGELAAGTFAGRAIDVLDLRESTGCSLVALGRGDEIHVQLRGLVIDAADRLYVCGPAAAVAAARFTAPARGS